MTEKVGELNDMVIETGFIKNKHGVLVKRCGLGSFKKYKRSTMELAEDQYEEIPLCCFQCNHLDNETDEFKAI